jgi:hypothetical protein
MKSEKDQKSEPKGENEDPSEPLRAKIENTENTKANSERKR